MTKKQNVHGELIQWGLWARKSDDQNIGYPTMTGFRRLAGAPLDWDYDVNEIPRAITITDDRAVELDKAIASLPLDIRTALYLHYHQELTIENVAKSLATEHLKIRVSRDKASQLLETGRRMVEFLSYPQGTKKKLASCAHNM